MIKLVNIKDKPTPSYDIYIGRANKWLNLDGSKWANPFVMKQEWERETVLQHYEEYIRNSPKLLKDLVELKDKVLGCYCYPKKCHGNILIKLLEEQCEALN